LSYDWIRGPFEQPRFAQEKIPCEALGIIVNEVEHRVGLRRDLDRLFARSYRMKA
jgi:hypothetical protein